MRAPHAVGAWPGRRRGGADGVVRWQSCVVPYADNVRVSGTQVGLAFNAEVYRVIARALADPERLPLVANDRGAL